MIDCPRNGDSRFNGGTRVIIKSGDRWMLFGGDNTGDCIGEFRVEEPMP